MIRSIVLDHIDPARHRPVIFGSRVTGSARRYSDVDIGFAGEPVPLRQIGDMQEAFDDSPLPYVVDLVNFNLVGDRFREVVLAEAVEIK